MLFSAMINAPYNVSNGWEIMDDEYNNTYIIHDSTRQKIRIGKNVPKDIKRGINSDNEEIKVSRYSIPDNIFVSNNNKNMNLSIMNYWTDDINVRNSYESPNILYITLYNSDYKLISYDDNNHDVIKTYRKSGYNQGCAILFNNSKEDELLFTIYAKRAKDFIKIEFHKDADNDLFTSILVLDGEDKKKIQNEYSKVSRKYVHFKMDFPDGKLATATYIVDPDYAEMAKELIKDIPNACMIVTGTESFYIKGKDKEKFNEIMTEQLKNARVKAITSIGVDVPIEFCKEFGILYLFNYDLETKKLVCLKSN